MRGDAQYLCLQAKLLGPLDIQKRVWEELGEWFTPANELFQLGSSYKSAMRLTCTCILLVHASRLRTTLKAA